ncbi:hypothetical protein ACGFJT_36760 [Actinomadura geliboluensis]|uniref:hypothetical protein n=1 Tax=Actinomadura geliboluensis TaxID=882440 RepID=UPI003718F0DA
MLDDDFALALAAARRSTDQAVSRTYSAGEPESRQATDALPARRELAGPESAPSAERECSSCGQVKDPAEFYKGRTKCKRCHQEVNTDAQRRRTRATPRKRIVPDAKRCSTCHTVSLFQQQFRVR